MDLFHRFAFEHRRLLAAAFTGLAVLTGLAAVRDEPDTHDVLVAARDLPSGPVVRAQDLRTAAVPPVARPSHALGRVATVGRRVAGPMREGEVVTDRRVLVADTLTGYGPGMALTSVRIDDAEGLVGIRAGDRVDVIAVDPDGEAAARVVAPAVEVVTVPAVDDESRSTSLRLATTREVALALAGAALESRFSIIVTS